MAAWRPDPNYHKGPAPAAKSAGRQPSTNRREGHPRDGQSRQPGRARTDQPPGQSDGRACHRASGGPESDRPPPVHGRASSGVLRGDPKPGDFPKPAGARATASAGARSRPSLPKPTGARGAAFAPASPGTAPAGVATPRRLEHRPRPAGSGLSKRPHPRGPRCGKCRRPVVRCVSIAHPTGRWATTRVTGPRGGGSVWPDGAGPRGPRRVPRPPPYPTPAVPSLPQMFAA